MRARRFAAVLTPVLLFALCGCPQSPQGGNNGNGNGNGAAEALLITGSDTMTDPVVAWKEAYQEEHPEAKITVKGGGSGTGIKALIAGETDLCMASRQIKESESNRADAAGVRPIRTVVGLDGIAVIVNPKNPVTELSLEQLKGIYAGETLNWADVGGPDAAPQVIMRKSNSGTYLFFKEAVLGDARYANSNRAIDSNPSIIDVVSQDEHAIGYVGLGYALGAGDSVQILRVKPSAEEPGVAPSIETVSDGSYPIARPLQFYTDGEPMGPAKAFLDYAKSPAGQRVLEKHEFVPLPGVDVGSEGQADDEGADSKAAGE